ncbi:MAG: Rieske (2Fe-2S) protein [Planctomycetota bacterium]
MKHLATLSRLKDGPLLSDGLCIWAEGDKVFAFDNRCPHLGFPMHKGSLKDGIVTCHWHQWRFDACGGGCLTAGGVDLPSYPVEMRGDEVWVDLRPRGDATAARWKLLDEGLREFNTSKIARAVVALIDAGTSDVEIVKRGALFGVAFRDEWASGLTILTAHANVLASLELAREDRILALVHGLRAVASDCENRPPPVPVEALPHAETLDMGRLSGWFRQFVEQRDGQAAKRCLLTMIAKGASPRELADAFLGALTDHVFLDGGHALDFTEKAFELLDRIGWAHAAPVLASLVTDIAGASRSEEDSDWRIPHDLVELIESAETGEGVAADTLLSDDPASVVAGLAAARPGAEDRLAVAALMRVARFHLRNEFFDWDTVHHAFTYAEAARRFVARASPGLPRIRALLHGAMDVYLVRFLNMPAAPVPKPREAEPMEEIFPKLHGDIGGKRVEDAARTVATWLAMGREEKELWRQMASAYLLEDHGFHTAQAFEAGLGLWMGVKGVDPQIAAVAVARYLSSHSPTNRTVNQTVHATVKLARGERLFEE